MKRDMDLIRRILAHIAEADSRLDTEAFHYNDYNSSVVLYHLELLAHKGFIDSKIQGTYPTGEFVGSVSGLTWDGQDFYEAMANEKVWRKTKEVITSAVGTTTFDVIRETLKLVSMQFIKTQMGI
jgi:hypothetical protein